MNNTRKQIIELIEPYMLKDLFEGCLIKIADTANVYGKIYLNWRYAKMVWQEQYYKCYVVEWYSRDNLLSTELKDKFKILWHYDITAVLKYVVHNTEFYNVELDWLWFYIERPDWISTQSFPNKPLHLYTEIQEKDLLDVLLKLK